ncbi:MAG: thioredoxin family protein, partial [Bacteroidaceae bacterium]|nr:thioredoxin family protein [Bacteroidaceae bacterium]
MKHFLSAFLLFFVCALAHAQNPVTASVQQQSVAGHDDLVDLVFSFDIQPGWHVYGPDNDGGPTPMTFNVETLEGAQLEGGLRLSPAPKNEEDAVFGCMVSYFEKKGTATQRLRLKGGAWKAAGYLEYGTCNDESCMPPTPVEFSYSGKLEKKDAKAEEPAAAAAAAEEEQPQEAEEAENDTTAADTLATAVPAATTDAGASGLWTPVIDELHALDAASDTQSRSLLAIFFLGVVGGLIALLTPCVWPIIPMTVSFFLKRAKDDKKKGIKDAITYGISIVVIYVTLGLLITGIFGASALNALSTNAVFNIFFCLLLVVFALSFFGWFELTLPSSWTNKVDSKASSTSGLLSIFLMAFTLSLVSFSCTGPIIGFLLVDFATSGSFWGPAIGMLGFAIALALPFTLFAMFPTWLKSAPKSGGWMNTIKVVLGFIELAFALKFFSVADLAYGWRLLDREVFLCLWIVIFGALGLYLIGKLKFQSDWEGGEMDKPMPVVCIMMGLCSIAFAIYMVPGLWGAPCKAVSAFAPPMSTQDFNLYKAHVVEAKYKNYEEGMAAAKALGKPVMVDFTGFGCVNCRKMEAAVWTDPQVAQKLENDYVLISLFVDDKTPLAKHIEVTEENGQKRTLRTVGDKWSYLQRSKFGANAQPFYVTLDNEGNPLGPSAVY